MSDNKAFASATLSWEDDIPASNEYGDVYFSLVDGLSESQYVFVDANDLPERLRHSNETPPHRPFIVSEAGFGTGLNFLLTWHNWLSVEETQRKQLHYISYEKHPVSKPDLEKALSKWPSLAALSKQLCDNYPPLMKGQHTITFESGNLRLTLIFGDICELSRQLNYQADCWFLDGFSPQKNPEMWSPQLFRQVARLSKQNTNFSTFAAASSVRKGLEAEGFEVKRRKGYGKKREMLHGRYIGSERPVAPKDSSNWSFPSPENRDDKILGLKASEKSRKAINNHTFDAIVIGAGLAGINTVWALCNRGLKVALIDEKARPVTGASGQSQLVMYAKFPSERNKLFNFVEHCLNHSLQHYQSNQARAQEDQFWYPCGLLQLAWNDKEADKQARFLSNISLPQDFIRPIDAEEASQMSGLKHEEGGLWFESAGWLDPKTYATHLLDTCLNSKHPVQQFYEEQVESLEQDENGIWTATTKSLEIKGDNIIVCNSNDAKRFSQLSHLPTKPLRGQVTSIKPKANDIEIKPVNCVLTGEGYLCPQKGDWHHFGATFNLDSIDIDTTPSDNQKNLDSIKQWNPAWLDPRNTLDDFEISSNAGLRCTTPDYLPIVGQAPVYNDMLSTFAKLRVGANSCKHLFGTYYDGLYVNVGHGSKGAFTTPIAAEHIATEICGGIPPLNAQMRTMLSPARFIIKHLKQRRI